MAASAIQRAFDRAKADHLTRTVRFEGQCGGAARYTVASSSAPVRYAVMVSADGTLYTCTCKGAGHDACKHRAAVATYRASRAGFFGRPDGPRHAVRGDRGYDEQAVAAMLAA